MRYLALAVVTLLIGCTRHVPADLVVRGGKIYTVNDQSPLVEAVAVRGDTIIYAGGTAGVTAYIGDKTRVIELGERTMTPGFIESHGHLMGLGYTEMRLHLESVKSYEQLIDMVKQAAASAAPGEWILGRGWHQDKWDSKPNPLVSGFQTHVLLSAVSPNNPVYLEHASGHAVFVNAKAMEIAGILSLSREKLMNERVEGGEIIRDRLGNPTGILIDNAKNLVGRHVPGAGAESDAKALSLAMAACARNGITSFHDAGTAHETIELYRRFKLEGKLTTRLYVMIESGEPDELIRWYRRGPEIDPQHLLTIRSIKVHADGALGTRSAWLLEPYSDRPGFYGMPTFSLDTLGSICRHALTSGFQVCTHAIGDRMNREVLNQYEKAFHDNTGKAANSRFRIEHAQHLDPDDIPRFSTLGVIASMQAIHLSSDRPWAIERLGKKRIEEGAYVWQSLLRSGAKVINGTDVPVEPINPVACFYAAVTRKTLKGTPEGGYEPEERMTRAQALRSYTLDAAFGSFEENVKGSIEQGKLADFTIFSGDLMSVNESDLLSIGVVKTIVGGKVVFGD